MKFLLLLTLISLSSIAGEFSIERYKGEVSVNSIIVTKDNFNILEINAGDTLVAKGKKSLVQVKSSGGSTFLIRNGELTIKKFEKKVTVVHLLKGKFFHYLDTKTKKRSFIVKTKTASLGVRGTKYMVEATDDKTYLCVCEGRVAIKSNLSKKLYTASKGEDIDVLNSMADFKVREASDMMYDMTAKEFSEMGLPL